MRKLGVYSLRSMFPNQPGSITYIHICMLYNGENIVDERRDWNLRWILGLQQRLWHITPHVTQPLRVMCNYQVTAITVTRVSKKQTSRYLGSLNQPSLLSPLAWYNKADHNTLPMANPQINLDWNLAVLTHAKASLSPHEGIFCGSFVMCNLKLTARARCLCIRRGFSSI